MMYWLEKAEAEIQDLRNGFGRQIRSQRPAPQPNWKRRSSLEKKRPLIFS